VSLPAPHDDVPAKVAAALERIGQAFRVLAQREAGAQGLSPIQLGLLLRLAADPAERRRLGALAREFDVSPASLSDSVAALERKGLVRRRRLDHDRRGFALALTAAGRRAASRARGVADPVERAVAALPPADQLALMSALYDVIAELQRAGVVTVARMCVACRHFRPGVRAGDRPHRCALLEVDLAAEDLRIDCPEHERAA
jgi:DNA-binding MarR family transcriptional regulator